MKINFDKRLMNPNFHWIMNCLSDETLRYIFAYGGSSSSKTYSTAQAILVMTLVDGCNTIVFRKIQASIKKSIFNDFKQIIINLQLEKFFTIQSFQIKCINGAVINFSGIEEERIKGISGFKRLVVDEITELTSAEFRQIRKRMRGIKGQQLIATFNPVSEMHWLKTEVYDKLKLSRQPNTLNNNYLTEVDLVERYDNYIFIKSTYKNNYWVVGSPNKDFGYLDINTIKDFDNDKLVDVNFYNIYALGQWGRIVNGSEFYQCYKSLTHTGSFDIDDTLPLYLTFDENVNPYLPMSVIQVEYGYIKVIDEILGISPHNNINSLIDIFANKYKNFKNIKIFIYGDSTSRRKDARTEDGYNLFGIIVSELTKHGFKDITSRVPVSNPSVNMSGIFMNRILAGLQSHNILINDSCLELKKDMLYLLKNDDGTIHKELVRDKSTGITYEKYGHVSDGLRYLCIEYLKPEYDKFINNDTEYEEYDISLEDDILSF